MPRKRSGGLAEGVATVAPTKRTRKKALDVAEIFRLNAEQAEEIAAVIAATGASEPLIMSLAATAAAGALQAFRADLIKAAKARLDALERGESAAAEVIGDETILDEADA